MKYYKDENVRKQDGLKNLQDAKKYFDITLHTIKMMKQIKYVLKKWK